MNGSERDARLLANRDLPAERGLVDVRERRDVVGEDGDALESCPHEPTVAGTRHRRPVSQPRRRYTLKRNSTEFRYIPTCHCAVRVQLRGTDPQRVTGDLTQG